MTTTQPLNFVPKTPNDALALEIARHFNDESHLFFYRQVCSAYDRNLVYRSYREALEVPEWRIKKSRKAIFLFILHTYDRQNKASRN